MRVVLLGDSHLARVRRDLRLIGPDVLNAAVGGAFAGDVAEQAAVVGLAPTDCAVVSVGTNDAAPWKQVSTDRFTAHLVDVLDASSPSRWVYVAPPGVDEERQGLRTNAVVSAYADAARAVFLERGARLVETPALLGPLGPRAFTEDGIHLTAAAYAVLLPAIAAVVQVSSDG